MMEAGAYIGFHAAYDLSDGAPRERGAPNALVGAYLGSLGLPQKAIYFATASPPEGMSWLTFEVAREVGIDVREFQSASRPEQPTVPPQAREFREGCYRRVYSRAHLAAHPEQTVAQMSLRLEFGGEPAVESFEISVRLRGRDDWLSNGGSCRADGSRWDCGVVCDGGGIAVTYRADGQSILVNLEEPFGYIYLAECGSEYTEPEDERMLKPGIDDKVFLLYETSCEP